MTAELLYINIYYISSDGSFKTFSNFYTSTYVDLENGLEKSDSYDIIRWYVAIGIDSNIESYGNLCIGVQNIDFLDKPINYSQMNAYCIRSQTQTYDVYEQDTGVYPLDVSQVQQKIGNQYRIEYEPKSGYLTITNLPFGGNEYVRLCLELRNQYFPNVIHYTGTSTYWYKVIYHKCLDRCTSCPVFQPSKCSACEDSENRLEAPGCTCKPGKYDDFEFPYSYYVSQTCKDNQIITELKQPKFEWLYNSNYLIQDDFDLFSNQKQTYGNIYGDFGVDGMILTNEDAFQWQIKIEKHAINEGYICFGVQTIEQNLDYRIQNHYDSRIMCGLCTSHEFRHSQCVTTTSQSQKGEQIKKQQLGIGEKYNLTYSQGILIISTEEFGGDLRYEFLLDEYQNYVPVITFYSSLNLPGNMQVRLQICHTKCESCQDWQPSQCLSCNDEQNRQGIPNCECKPGYEDYYDRKFHKICRPKIQWNELQSPEWEWKHYGSIFTEDYQNENDGTFKVINYSTGQVYIKKETTPILQNNSKWTIRILGISNNYSFLCFGVQDTIQYYQYYNESGNSEYSTYSVSVCTNQQFYYHHRHSAPTFQQGTMPDMSQGQTFDFDIYYQSHLLTITNENYGGDYRWEFPLYIDRFYVPNISKSYRYNSSGFLEFQVRGCVPRCRSCIAWNPTSCITCNDAENRVGVNCDCKPNYEDFYDHRKQKICRSIPILLKPAPPKWVWQSQSNEIIEDVKNLNNGVFLRNSDTSQGSIMLQNRNIIEPETQWEINLLDHGNTHKDDYICFGVIQIEYAYYQGNYISQSNTICTNNSQYIYNGYTGSDSKTKIIGQMPTTIDERSTLAGKKFTIKYLNQYMNISDGQGIEVDFHLKANIQYTPYIYAAQRTTFQVKGCSPRCLQCIDFSPKQCTICNDENYRQSAPSCLCKEGYYDTYDHKFNKKCIPKPIFTQMEYPEWEWYSQSSTLKENKNLKGVFDTTDYNGHQNFFVKGFPELEDQQKWTINIKQNPSSKYNFICFGIMQTYFVSELNWNTSLYTISVMYCTDSSIFINGSSSYNQNTKQPFIKEQFTNNSQIDIYFEKNKLTISELDYGGSAYIEMELYPDATYTPAISMYTRYPHYIMVIQFQNCNYKCDSCYPWQPNRCFKCKGKNREQYPSCECKQGYVDYYDNIQQIDCIIQPNEVIPNNWQWEIKDDQGRMQKEGESIYFIGNNKNSYSTLYPNNVSQEGIQYLQEGIKSSVKIENMYNSNDHICFGIQKMENYNTQNFNSHAHNRSIVMCTFGTQISQDSGSALGTQQESGTFNKHTYNIGLTYDIIFKKHVIEFTNKPYGGTYSSVVLLNTWIKFIPVIELYKSYKYDYKLQINIKPCAYQCEKCDILVSKSQCTQCKEDSFRSGSSCECQATYYDAGTVQCAECISPCVTCKSETFCLSCISGVNRASNPPFCTCLDEYFEDTEGECVQCEQQCEVCLKDADNCTACKVQTGRSLIFPKCACLDGYYEDTGTKSCQQCHESCNKCVDNTTACTECKSNQVMTPEGVCGCSISSYEVDGVCTACVSPCLMCEDETTCKSCRYPTPNRLDSPECTCKEGFYEDSSNRCLPCMEGCIECKDTANNCSKCIVDPNRSQDPFSCACNEGYIFNKISNLCKIASCPDKCSECVEGSSTQCDTCKEGDYNRLLIEDNCDCAQGYYEGGSVYCLQCNVECKSCTSLVGCTQCISALNRGPEPYCQCDEGFYEDGSGNCEKCHYKCKVCAGTYDSCTQCINTDINRSQSGQCTCNPGYEEDTENQICQERISCDFKCETCNPPDLSICTKCLEGPYFRKTLSSNCNCIDGYYDNKVEPTCQKCEAPCQNCELDEQNNIICLTCLYDDEFRNEAPNCLCPEGYTEDKDNNICQEDTGCKVEFGRNQEDCSCIQGYYDDPIYLSCIKCDPQCKNCETTSSTCTECALGYQSSSFPACISCDRQCEDCASSPSDCTSCNLNRDTLPGCGCFSGYYDDMLSPDCKKCNLKCGECSDSNTCITCATNEEGRISASKGCTCKTGYFKDSTGYCQKCSSWCLSCEKSADYCIICAYGLQRNFIAPTCGCNIGYFAQNGSNNCAKCSDECVSRDNETGIYTNSAGGTYSFGVYDPIDKLNFIKSTDVITGPIEIPSTYVDDGEGNLVPESYFEKIQTAKAIQEAQDLIYQQQQEAQYIQQQLEQKAEELLQQQEQLEIEQQQVEEQQQQLVQQETQVQQKEQEINTILEEITEKNILLQEKQNQLVQKVAQIENIQEQINVKQLAGEDTTELEQKLQLLEQQKTLLEEEITEIQKQIQQQTTFKQTVEAEKLILDQQLAEKLAEVQQSQEQLQINIEELQSAEQEIQEQQEQLEIINEQIVENSQTIIDLGGTVDDGEGQNNGNNGSNNGSNTDGGGQNSSVSVNSGNISQIQCQGGCADCQEQTPNICKRCKTGIKRQNNPPFCTCIQGYYQQGSSEDCRSCPLTCSECKSFDQCLKCQTDSNRQVDQITGKCVCISGFTEQRFGIECQRCYYYDNICYQKCPKNTILDINTQNCLQTDTQLEDIRITILIIGIIAFIVQLSIFGLFTLLAKKRNFDQLFPKFKSNNQEQSSQPLKLEEEEKNSSEDSNSDSQIQINNKTEHKQEIIELNIQEQKNIDAYSQKNGQTQQGSDDLNQNNIEIFQQMNDVVKEEDKE